MIVYQCQCDSPEIPELCFHTASGLKCPRSGCGRDVAQFVRKEVQDTPQRFRHAWLAMEIYTASSQVGSGGGYREKLLKRAELLVKNGSEDWSWVATQLRKVAAHS